MTVSEALRKKNLIDLSIEGDKKRMVKSIIEDIQFIDIKKKGENKSLIGKKCVKDVQKEIQSNYDKVEAQLKNRYSLDRAIKLSNANTKITVAGEEMTIAEAIEYEKSHKLELKVIAEFKTQLANVRHSIAIANEDVDERIQEQKIALLGNDKSANSDAKTLLKSITELEDNNRLEAIDPLDLEKKINDREARIQEFLMEINDVKNTSNATTTINVEMA